jgi:predicted metal-dependent hydrolase
MPDSQTVQIEGIGAVLFERSRRAHRILITVRPGRGIRVAVPGRASLESAVAFVRVKKLWLKKHLARIREYEKQKKAFNDIFLNIDRTKARRQIINRLHYLAQRYEFRFGKASVRNQRTRWGSCSVKGNISLNIKLVALSPELLDYVILHELIHTKVHNHSKKFWWELDKYVGDGKALARKLIEYGVRLL